MDGELCACTQILLGCPSEATAGRRWMEKPCRATWGRLTSSSSLSSCTVGVCVFSWMFDTASPCTLNFSAAASWACWDKSSIWRREGAEVRPDLCSLTAAHGWVRLSSAVPTQQPHRDARHRCGLWACLYHPRAQRGVQAARTNPQHPSQLCSLPLLLRTRRSVAAWHGSQLTFASPKTI